MIGFGFFKGGKSFSSLQIHADQHGYIYTYPYTKYIYIGNFLKTTLRPVQ